MAATIDPRAGHLADPKTLIDVSRLVTAYFANKPDVGVAAQRVAFGTSGHRGSSFDTAFNENHILAISQAICDYRRAKGIDGPLFIGADTHALSAPALVSALEVFAANDVTVMIDECNGLYADARRLARDPFLQSRPHAASCRRRRYHALAQSAAGRRLQIQSAERRAGRRRRDRRDREGRQRHAGGRPCRRETRDSFTARWRPTSSSATTTSRPMSPTLLPFSTWRQSARRA